MGTLPLLLATAPAVAGPSELEAAAPVPWDLLAVVALWGLL